MKNFQFAMNQAMAGRNATMIRLHKEGHSCAAIARLFGLSSSRVWQIVRWNGTFATIAQQEVSA